MSEPEIDYRVRPAKHIERKMLCEMFRCLHPFGAVESYRYWGFGAIYFADFALIHKVLGLHNMLSMERNASNQERFVFNRPYSCVTLDFRPSQEVLAIVPDWDVRTIAWFDYTDKLDDQILSDIHCFIVNACVGSIIVVSVNCQADRAHTTPGGVGTGETEAESQGPLEKLRERVGKENVPKDVTEKQLSGWGTAVVSKRIIDNTIAEALSVRNGPRIPGTLFKYKQVVHFHYADGAKMLTVGGLIFGEGQETLVGQCGFENLNFYKGGSDAYKIDVPLLTPKEKRYLDSQLPISGSALVEALGIPTDTIERYMKVYRYFPTFSEVES